MPVYDHHFDVKRVRNSCAFVSTGGPGENAAAQAWANAFNLSNYAAGLEDFDFLGGPLTPVAINSQLNSMYSG
jgi:hypothetical protein